MYDNFNIFFEEQLRESYYRIDKKNRIHSLLEKTSSTKNIVDFITCTGGF